MDRMVGRRGMRGLMGINGRPMDMDRIDVRVPLGSIECAAPILRRVAD